MVIWALYTVGAVCATTAMGVGEGIVGALAFAAMFLLIPAFILAVARHG